MKTCSKCRLEKPVTDFGKLRRTSDGLQHSCKPCVREKHNRYYAENREKVLARQKVDYEKNRESRKAAAKEYRVRNADVLRQRRRDEWKARSGDMRSLVLLRKYGISAEDYEAMLSGQGGGCAICGRARDEQARALAVDHCHKTGAVRGILCSACNTGIGNLQDDPVIVRAALDYLNKHAGRGGREQAA